MTIAYKTTTCLKIKNNSHRNKNNEKINDFFYHSRSTYRVSGLTLEPIIRIIEAIITFIATA